MKIVKNFLLSLGAFMILAGLLGCDPEKAPITILAQGDSYDLYFTTEYHGKKAILKVPYKTGTVDIPTSSSSATIAWYYDLDPDEKEYVMIIYSNTGSAVAYAYFHMHKRIQLDQNDLSQSGK